MNRNAFIIQYTLLFALLAPFFAYAEFKVGVILPLSGPLVEYGSAVRNGIQLAQGMGKEAFANCRFVVEDSQYESPKALAAFQKLVNLDRASIVYAFGGPIGEALAPVANSRKFPLLTNTLNPKVSEGRQFVFRYAPENLEFGKALSAKLKALGRKKVAVIHAENQYIEAILNGFRKAATADGIELIEVASVNPREQDLRFLTPKLHKLEFDTIGVFLMTGQIRSFLVDAKPYLVGKTVIGGDFFESEEEVENSQGGLEGAFYPNVNVQEGFREAYGKRFHNYSQIKFAAEGYDVANMLATKFCGKQAQGTQLDAESVIVKLKSVQAFKGAQGETSFVESEKGDKYFTSPVFAMTIRGKEFVVSAE